jgi:hypothetical protein
MVRATSTAPMAICERLDPSLQRLLRPRLVLGLKFTRVAGIDILEPELLSVRDSVRVSRIGGRLR